jgi:oxidase EvaA
MDSNQINNLFLRSALTEENPFISTAEVRQWLQKRKDTVEVNVERIAFDKLNEWKFDKKNGNLRHLSGKFFSIEGIKVSTSVGEVLNWEQPIINQPEIGLLGILTKKVDGILYFLLQAKIEPGNINHVQLAPTLQATESNFTMVHKGKKPLFLDYFLKAEKEKILLNQLQSEQGARFLKKRNRNIIVISENVIPDNEYFVWLTLAQIKKLMKYDNFINMDTRTVVSGIPYGRYAADELRLFETYNIKTNENAFSYDLLRSTLDFDSALHSFDEIIAWLTALKAKYKLQIEKKSLLKLKDWKIGKSEIFHIKQKYFKIFAANISISNREVKSWQQPLVEPVDDGIIAFIVKKINGVMHMLVQAKLECGNYDILEMAPTVQCITDSYDIGEDLPFLSYVLNAKPNQIKLDTMQSEEGGRFFKEQNRNMIIQADDDFPMNMPENFIWLTINQLSMFLKFNNYLNIQSRSLIAALDFLQEFEFISGDL